ncbi:MULTISPECIES: hemerythrin domain-containing protein [Anaeromyxobacter]|uniref:hemerythrin domain-containing protein n=1 Tax=Anaeromyxobacter TaxID=161492 RepID=UPI001F569F1E|nr:MULTISPECIES: hemerythrin domain-containing protein [unclassified Anaeromyxobacter]
MLSTSPPAVTAPLRAQRARLRETLAAIDHRVGALAGLEVDAAVAEMRAVVSALDACLRPHLAWEERTLHPVVDKYACEGPAAFSASMRYEHDIIHRWSAELARRAGGDPRAFVRHADRLLGVVLAHFELEEHVLFPILDRTLGGDAYRAQIGDPPEGSGRGGSR